MDKKPEIQKIYSLTPMQEGMLFHSLIGDDSNTYFEQLSFNINGQIDIDLLKKSLNKLVERTEVFRTVFIYEKLKNPKQVVLKERAADLFFEDISHFNKEEKKKHIEDFKLKDRARGFNLAKDMPMRMAAFKTDDQVTKLIWSFHHIIMDGWCLGIVIKELFQIYQSLLGELPISLPSVQPYSDYIKWLEKQDENEASTYWGEYLADFDNQTIIPCSNDDKVNNAYENREVIFQINKEDTESLLKIAKSNQSTLNIVIQAVWSILLKRYNNADDVVFGSVVSGRTPEVQGIENMVGLFINTVPVRVKFNLGMNFIELLGDIQQSSLASKKYHYYSLPKIQAKTQQKQSLISHILAFENYPKERAFKDLMDGKKSFGISIDGIEIFEQTNYDFNIIVMPDSEITVKIAYNAALYNRSFIERISGHFKSAVKEIIKNPMIKIDNINVLTAEERLQIIHDFNNTKANYPKDKTIHSLFEEQAVRTPDNTAIVFEGESLTYKSLNEKANQLARKLRDEGIVKESIVAIMLDPSVEMIIALLAVLKAGGAYLPIDPVYPSERIKFTLEDSGTDILISKSDHIKELSFKGRIVDLKNKMWFEGNNSNLYNINSSDNLAYIIYTSGTTGKPKGVMIEHRNVVRLMFNDKNLFDFTEKDVWTMFHSFCFDFSVWEIYGALLYGGKLVIVPRLKAKEPNEYLKILEKEKVTILNQTPTAFNNLVNAEISAPLTALSIRYVIFGGEALKPIVLKKWKMKYPDTKFINMYGITETTVHVTFKEITQNEIDLNISNIGKSIPTLTTYILDSNLNLVPIGVAGELCVGGDGVGRGYLNREELTRERFIENPHKAGERLYKSGDLARMLPNGEMEYLGRIDHQVKIRGHRIELGEIESQLLKHEHVRETVVSVKEKNDGNKYLCAYIVTDKEVTITELHSHLEKELPIYMIPSRFIKIEKIPLTSNGKVDRKCLNEIEGNISYGSDFVPPSDDIEERLATIWKEVLGVDRVGVTDNFFSLGGDSLAIIRVLAGVIANNWNIAMQDFYKYQTIRELSQKITGAITEESDFCIKDNVIVQRNLKDNAASIAKCEEINYENILLTGATGYLGVHLLDELLKQTKANIYCLVRGSDPFIIEKRLSDLLTFYFGDKYEGFINNRIFVVNGDITSNNFGLTDHKYFELGEKTDLIIHAAALVKHYGEYKEFQRINVLGTREIINFAKKFNCRLSHISTMSVSGSVVKTGTDNNIFTENDFFIGQDYLDNVYVRSKFEAENIIYKAIKSGLNANVFRVGNLTGRYIDGHFQYNINENNFYRIIRSFIELAAVSEDMVENPIEFTPVDFCSRSIVQLTKSYNVSGKALHIYNHQYVKLGYLLKVFRFFGVSINVLPQLEFSNLIEDVSKDNIKKEVLTGLVNYFDYRKGQETNKPVVIDSKITISYLNQIGFYWPEIEESYLKKIIQYMIQADFIKI